MAIVSPPPEPPPPRPARRGSDRLRLTAAGFILAIVGGAAAIGLALLAGALHASAPATTVVQAAPVTAAPARPRATWASVYAAADAGAVDITAQHTTTVPGPLGSEQRQETALGAGFVVDGRGDIVTAEHVVSGASTIRVRLADGTTRSAVLVATDASSDIAVVRVDPSGLTLHPLPLGSSASLAAGDPLALLGDPLGFDRSLSTGVVSALDRTIQAPNGYQISHAIQTDAAMNPGNSGGPLLNTRGQVIGIADQIATGTDQFGAPSGTETSTGVGFAVPIDLIKGELPDLERGRAPAHAYLGVAFTASATDGSGGADIGRVEPGTPAARAGLRRGDAIITFGGTRIASESDLVAALAACHPGEQVRVTARRGSTRVTVTVTLGTRP